MKKKRYWVLVVLFLFGWFWLRTPGIVSSVGFNESQEIPLVDSRPFTLKKGDILARANWSWMPGSSQVKGGERFGHVAIVTEDMTGRTIDEVLANTTVVEALFYDQATRNFVFRKEDQIRESSAAVSFGNRFKGKRYRLRVNLNEEQTEAMIRFLKNQLEGGYNLLSFKNPSGSTAENENRRNTLKQADWHCATLTWEAYLLAAGIDIDSNGGWLIYPSDIIACKNFDLPGGRIRF